MPVAPSRPCRYAMQGCRQMAAPGNSCCPDHTSHVRRVADQRRMSDETVAKVRRWYRQRIWFARRDACLKAALYRCATPGCMERATDCDHIRPHRGDWSLFIESSNHQALCHSCHSRKTAREDGGFGNRRREAGQGVGG
ncbi:HNH endonuclease [Chromobacterium piscinae]|uniref:HNH endonuclease signature motif containing protein n=1 Tax=Chromobacterium piscinae TaxID=686831 RepID=UPI001E31A427|nr:HNH endonuclease signature motif containing protein [Chromobacterium piscinae]MCD4504782.1 HNH endonuclease [Chromobacterium piscinae]